MSRGQIALLAGLAVVAVGLWALLITQLSADIASAPPASGTVPNGVSSPLRPGSLTAPPASSAAPSTGASPVAPSTEPPSDPTPATVTPDPAQPDDPRLAYAEFLVHLDATRSDAQRLNEDLRTAGEAGDTAAVRATADAIDALVEREGGWLRSHPPADCYADAHATTLDLLAAYDEVGTQARRWSDATGLAALGALADLYAAVEDATGLAEAVGVRLEAVSCVA